jgi:phosphoribosylanthranilate isomerase
MIVKVCGVTDRSDALAAIEAGVSALGFNFWAKSPRYITVEKAQTFVPELPAGVLRVGVFVNESAAVITATARRLVLNVVQLHGQCEIPVGLRVWKAMAAGSEPPPIEDQEALLVDAPSGELYGGTGQTFDWSRVRGLAHRVVLAGGLDSSNVGRAIEMARPWGVDACSRIESAPGRKDIAKMRAFIAAALGSQS